MKREWLEKIRNNIKKTHEEIAEAAGIERAYYTMIENGTRNPSVEVAKRIAAAMGFDWTFFYNDQCNDLQHTGTESGR